MQKDFDKHIRPLEVDGLKGRELIIKSDAHGKTFLLIGGQHHLHEKIYPVAQFLSQFGDVYMPDIPGFGGMDSFRTVGKPINVDSFADYLHSYIKMRDLRDVWICPISVSTLYVIRLLQKYPEIHPRINQVITLVGFSNGRDFDMPRWKWWSISALCHVAKFQPMSRLIHLIAFNRYSFKLILWFIERNHTKFSGTTDDNRSQHLATETKCWMANDHQTHAQSTLEMFHIDLEQYQDEKLPFTIHNVAVVGDQYFNHDRLKQSMMNLFEGYEHHPVEQEEHSPADLGDMEGLSSKIPESVIGLMKNG